MTTSLSSRHRKLPVRVLLITSTPPIPTGGGSMLLYRHFCERDDFEISVITDNVQILDHSLPYKFLLLQHSKLWNRLVRTRLSKQFHSLNHLFFGTRVAKSVWQQAAAFNPDVVLTVAGSWSWTSRLAKQVARRLDVPLVGSFMDWWSYNQIYTDWAAPHIESEFRSLYQSCDLSLCISEGMESALGRHPNSAVVYPIGSKRSNILEIEETQPTERFTLAFGGNLGDWYGKMLESLVTTAKDADIRFELYGGNTSWSQEFDERARSSGIYRGYLPLPKLRAAFHQVDALFLMMGFDSACAQVESTSFKSKFLEYLAFEKPIFVWGPAYCSAVQYAKEFDSAEVCTSPNPTDFLNTILKVKDDLDRQQQLVENARIMYSERFHPDKIHQLLVDKLMALTA